MHDNNYAIHLISILSFFLYFSAFVFVVSISREREMSLFDNHMSRFRETTSFSSRLGLTTSDIANRKRVNVLDFWILLQRLDAERAVSRLQQQVLFFPSPFNLFSYSLSITFVASDIVFLRVSFSFSFRN